MALIEALVALVAKGFWHQKREHENIGSRSKKNILAGMNGQDPLKKTDDNTRRSSSTYVLTALAM